MQFKLSSPLCKNLISFVHLSRCETSSSTIRKEQGQRQNSMPRRLFLPTKKEGRGVWRRLHKQTLHVVGSSLHTTMAPKLRWRRRVTCMENMTAVYYNVTFRCVVQSFLQWKGNKYYIFCVCVCSLWYSVCNAHAPYCCLWPVGLCSSLPH